MALVIEDGSLVAGANSFVTRAAIIGYAADRGVTLEDTAATDVFAFAAMDFLQTQCFKGDPVAPSQNLPFPRNGLVDGDTAAGFAHTIPTGIKNAQLQLALDSASGTILANNAQLPLEVQRSKVGPIERQFFAPERLTLDGTAPLTVARAWLKPHLCTDSVLALRAVRV